MKKCLPIIGLALVITGCEPVPQITRIGTSPVAASPTLPKFKLVNKLDGDLFQVLDNGQVVVTVNHPGSNVNQPAILVHDYPLNAGKANDPVQLLYSGTKSQQFPARSFLDEGGKTLPFPARDLRVIEFNGRTLAGTPLDFPSSQYFYYSTNAGVFCSPRGSTATKQIFDQPITRTVYAGQDQLVVQCDRKNDQTEFYKIAPNKPAEKVYSGPTYDLTGVGPDGEILVKLLETQGVVESPTKVKEFAGSNFDLSYVKVGNRSYPIGFASNVNGNQMRTFPVMWTEEGKPVRLIELCSELKDKLEKIDGLFSVNIQGTKSGLIVFNFSGWKCGPDVKPGDVDWYEHSTQIYRTYVLRAQ